MSGDSPRTPEGGQAGKDGGRWWELWEVVGIMGAVGDGGRWWELWEGWELWEQWERWEVWEWCRDLWVVRVLREARTCEPHGQFVGIMGSASCKDGLIKNFAKGVAGEAIKTFGKV